MSFREPWFACVPDTHHSSASVDSSACVIDISPSDCAASLIRGRPLVPVPLHRFWCCESTIGELPVQSFKWGIKPDRHFAYPAWVWRCRRCRWEFQPATNATKLGEKMFIIQASDCYGAATRKLEGLNKLINQSFVESWVKTRRPKSRAIVVGLHSSPRTRILGTSLLDANRVNALQHPAAPPYTTALEVGMPSTASERRLQISYELRSLPRPQIFNKQKASDAEDCRHPWPGQIYLSSCEANESQSG